MPDSLKQVKTRLKSFDFIRENYRRLRKIFLHIVHGRFYSALKLANYYNPVYRLLIRNPAYVKMRQRNKLVRILRNIYSYPQAKQNGKYSVALILRNGSSLPSSSAFIRLIGPLTDASVKDKISLQILSAQKLPEEIKADFAVVQRTAFDNQKQAEKLVRLAASEDIKIIVDNDDAFHTIDESHPEYYQQTKRTEAIEYLFDKAGQIWVSTENLIRPKFKAKTRVVGNTLDERLWETQSLKRLSRGPLKMVYMGTATHDADFEMILPALDKVYKDYPKSFELAVIGVSQNLPNRPWIERLTTPYLGSLYPSFVKWFLSQGPFDIGLSPLVDNDFNRAKSDIKCLDYLAAGIIPVVSDIEPYRSQEIKDFIVKIKNDEASWAKELSRLAGRPDKFRADKQKTVQKARSYIWQNRSSKDTGKILLKYLEDLES